MAAVRNRSGAAKDAALQGWKVIARSIALDNRAGERHGVSGGHQLLDQNDGIRVGGDRKRREASQTEPGTVRIATVDRNAVQISTIRLVRDVLSARRAVPYEPIEVRNRQRSCRTSSPFLLMFKGVEISGTDFVFRLRSVPFLGTIRVSCRRVGSETVAKGLCLARTGTSQALERALHCDSRKVLQSATSRQGRR